MRFSNLFEAVRHHADWPSLRCLAGLLFAAYLPSLVGVFLGTWPFAEDAPALFAPWRDFARQNLLAGRLPLWNPHLFCGLPFLANGQSSVGYAPNLIYLLLPLRAALWGDAFAHTLLLAGGGYALARALGLGRQASFLVGLCLSLGGPVSAHLAAGHLTWHAARAWIPWQMWALLQWVRSGRPHFAVALVLCFVAQIYAGYPPLVGLGAGLCLILLMVLLVARRRDEQSKRVPLSRLLWLGAGCIGLIGLLAAAVIGPLREVSAQSVHGSGLTWEEATRLSGGPRTLLRAVLPGFFGGNERRQWSLLYGAHEEASYIGLVSLLLALSAPWLVWHNRQSNSLARTFCLVAPLLMLIAALLSFGANTPLYGLLFDHLPPFHLLRIPVRWMELWYFAAALLAGFGWEELRCGPTRKYRRATTMLRISLAALGVAFPLIGLLAWWSTADAEVWPRLSALVDLTRDAARREALIGYFRAMMVGEAVWGGVLAGAGWWLVRRFGHHRPRLCRALMVLIAVDLLALCWRDTRLMSSVQSRRQIEWAPSVTARYRPGERWTSALDWRGLNGAMSRGVDLFGGYDAMNGRRFWPLADAVEGHAAWTDIYQPMHSSPLLRVAGVTAEVRLLRIKQTALGAGAHLIASEGQWQLWRRPGAWPRVYIADRILRRPEEHQTKALINLAGQDYAAGRYPVVLSPQALPGIGDATPAAAVTSTAMPKVLWWRRSTNRFSVAVQSAHPSVLVCGEAWSEGWRAWVNNREVEVVPANVLFRAVPLPGGIARVEMVYEPPALRSSVFWTLCGLSILSALAMLKVGRR